MACLIVRWALPPASGGPHFEILRKGSRQSSLTRRARLRTWSGMAFGPWRAIHCLGLVLALLLATPALRAQGSAPTSGGVESYREFTLDNGLRVVLAEDHRVPQVALRIEYAVGDALDPPDQRGLAQLIGVMLPKLQTRHLSALERPRLLQAAGFKFEEPGVQVSPDMTAVTLQVPAEALDLALWLEADRMQFAADGITQSTMTKAWPRVQELVERAPNEPGALTALRAALGRAHPYGGLDRPANLSKAGALAVAERLRRYYNPASAVLVLVGDFDTKQAEPSVRRLFARLPSARVTPLPIVARQSAPQLVSLLSPVPARFSGLVWETPALFTADDQVLDVIATVLSRRLAARKLCETTRVAQRSYRLTSVFVASCEAPKTSSDVWRSAFSQELGALAEGHVPAAEVEGAALHYLAVVSDRYDDLLGRAQLIARAVHSGRAATQAISESIEGYEKIDLSQVAAVVRRHLLRPADGSIEITPSANSPRGGPAYFGSDFERTFKVPAEAPMVMPTTHLDWPRPPANGMTHRFQPPTGPTDTLPNGDQIRFIERFGVRVAHVEIQIPWPAGTVNPAARPVLAELLETSPVDGQALTEKLRAFGAELAVYGRDEHLSVSLVAPSSRVASAFEVLARALSQKELSNTEFDSAKERSAYWVKRSDRDEFSWYWDALGASATKTRYAYSGSSARKSSLGLLSFSDVAHLWQVMAKQPRAVSLVGPFDGTSARTLATQLVRRERPSGAAIRPAKPVVFQTGVYLFDRIPPNRTSEQPAPESVDVCLLWPIATWATQRHYPAHLMSWFFRTDIEDGLGARFDEHKAGTPIWQSNSLLTRDQDFLRYSFRVPLDRLTPMLESLQEHLKRLGEGRFAKRDLENAIAAERQYQLRRSLSGQSMIDALARAAAHDKQGNEALDIALHIDRVAPAEISELAQTLKLERAIIGIIGPAAAVTAQLATVGMKPTSTEKPEVSSEGESAR